MTLTFSSNVSLSGNLYDAAAHLEWSSGVDAYGSVYAGNFHSSSATRIHYDRQVIQAGQGCPGPAAPDGGPTGCNSCTDCNNQACVGGVCGMCTSSSPCCAPLSCINGSCVLPIQ